MPKPSEDIDWYVEMSERMERRDERRKWILLAVAVLVPLVVMGGFLLYLKLDKMGFVSRVKHALRGHATEEKPVKEAPVAPVSVAELHKGAINFPQLDADDMVTSITYSFREMLPEGAAVFTVNRDDDTHGKVIIYRLRNVATGDLFVFNDVPVSKIGSGWALTEDGWTKVKNELQARMGLRLGQPTIQGE